MKNIIFFHTPIFYVIVLLLISCTLNLTNSMNLRGKEVKTIIKVSSSNTNTVKSLNEVVKESVLKKENCNLVKSKLSTNNNTNTNAKVELNKTTNLLQASSTSLTENKVISQMKSEVELKLQVQAQAQAAFEIAKKKYELDRLNAFAELII